MPIGGVPLALVAGGAVLVYSGVENRPVADIFRNVAKGQAPTPGPGGGLVASGTATATGDAIANDALQYKGAGYVWAGAPGSGSGNWDCSSFANAVVGRDLRLAIPGYPAGTYQGQAHGPNTVLWLATTLCTTVGHSGAQAQAGDLCVWQTHMGIAIGGGQMISAQDPANGTQISGIDGFIPEILFIRRLNATVNPLGGGGVRITQP